MNYYKSQDSLLKYFNTNYQDLNELPFYRYEYMIKNLEEIIEKEKAERDKERRKQELQSKRQQTKSKKRNKVPGFKMPKYK